MRRVLWYLLTFFAGFALALAITDREWMIAAVVAAWCLGSLFCCACIALASVPMWKLLIERSKQDDASSDGLGPAGSWVADRGDPAVGRDQGLARERAAAVGRFSGMPESAPASGTRAGVETKAQPQDLSGALDPASLHQGAQVVSPVTATKMQRLVEQLVVFLRGVPIRNLDDVDARVALLHATFLPAVELHHGDRAAAIQTIQPAYDALRGSMLWTGEGLARLLAALQRNGLDDLEGAEPGKAVH